MTEIKLNSTVHYLYVLRKIETEITQDDKEEHIYIGSQAFFNPCGISTLANIYLQLIGKGYSVSFVGDRNILNYLSRLNFFSELSIDFVETITRRRTSTIVPVMQIKDEMDVQNTCNTLCEFVLKNIPNSSNFLPAFEWCINEVIDNIRNHSQSSTPGIVCGQYYPATHKLLISIVDSGIGIKDSLSEGHSSFATNIDAIKLA